MDLTKIHSSNISDESIEASKLVSGSATNNIGYTPVNQAGDTMLGGLQFSNGASITNNDHAGNSMVYQGTFNIANNQSLVIFQNSGGWHRAWVELYMLHYHSYIGHSYMVAECSKYGLHIIYSYYDFRGNISQSGAGTDVTGIQYNANSDGAAEVYCRMNVWTSNHPSVISSPAGLTLVSTGI